jgi:hypothetical protein
VSASVFAARVCVKSATHGKVFWQHPLAIPVTFDTLGMRENSFELLYCKELEGCEISIRSGLMCGKPLWQSRQTIEAKHNSFNERCDGVVFGL